MHTLQALKIIGKAIQLWDSGFTGDVLAEACKGADPLDVDALRCVIRAETAHLGFRPSIKQTLDSLRVVAMK